MHLTSNPVDWYAARAAGIVAYLLLTAVLVAGVGLAGKVRVQSLPRPSMVEIHRFGGLLVGTFVALHVATIAIDAFLPFSLAQLGVPFLASYRPLWTALGIVAAEFLVALAISNRLRGRLPYRVWRRIHYLNFAVWIGATLHGIGAGTDSRAPWAVAMYTIAVGTVVTVCAVRFSPRSRRLAWPAGLALGAVGAIVLGAAVLAIAPSIKHQKTIPAGRGFDDTLTGRVSRRDGTVEELVSLAGRGTGADAGAGARRPAPVGRGRAVHLAPARVPPRRSDVHRKGHAGRILQLRRRLPAPRRIAPGGACRVGRRPKRQHSEGDDHREGVASAGLGRWSGPPPGLGPDGGRGSTRRWATVGATPQRGRSPERGAGPSARVTRRRARATAPAGRGSGRAVPAGAGGRRGTSRRPAPR